MSLSLVLAVDRSGAIGRDGDLPWPRLGRDLKWFRVVTWGQAVIMGRKTWESLGRALPGRKNIVVSRQKDLPVPDSVVVVSSVAEALALTHGEDAAVIGGAQLAQQVLPLIDRFYLTTVDDTFAADTYFHGFDCQLWTCHYTGWVPATPSLPALQFQCWEKP